VLRVLHDCNQIWIFSTDFHRSTPLSNFTEIRPVGAGLIHADGRTDVKKLDFKLPPCSECYIPSFGRFPGLWILYADVQKNSVCSVFVGGVSTKIFLLQDLWRWRRQSVPKRRRIKFRRRGIFCLHHLRRWNRVFRNVDA